MPATEGNLSEMVDLAVGTTEVGAINANILNTLLHSMLKRLNILDGQADLNNLDRDLLSASEARELSVSSDVEGGRDDDAEDALGEMSSSMPTLSTGAPSGSGGRTPYQLLEIKIAKMQEQLESITSVPSNKHLFEKAKTQYEEKPIGEMWLNMQLMGRVEINEKGIAKCTSMIEDMTKEMQALVDEHKKQTEQIKGLNVDDLMERLNAMEKSMNEMNDKFNTLPSPDDFAQFVTGAGLEDALQGIRNDLERLPSADDIAQFVTEEILEDALQGIRPELEDLQQPTERDVIETSSQTDPVAEMKKLDQGALDHDGLNVSSEILEEHQELKEQVDAHGQAAAMEQIGESLEPIERLAPPPSQRSVPANVELLLQHEKEMQSLALIMTAIQMKVYMLEDRLNLIQGMIKDDFRRWEIKHETDHEEEIRSVFNQNQADRIRNLAYVVNDQLHDIRDDITALNEELKKKAKVGENPLEGTDSADFEDMDQDALLKALKANREEIKKLFAYYDELQVTKADRTEGDVGDDKSTLDQMQQQANSHTSTCPVAERQKGNMCESEQKAYQVHFGNVEAFQDQRNGVYFYDCGNAEIDVYTTNKSDGGQLTTSHHKRLTKLPHVRNTIVIEEEETKLPHVRNTIIIEEDKTNPLYKEEVIVQGTDGNIYKGRMRCLEAKPPLITQAIQDPSYIQRRDKSTQPIRYKVMQLSRPSSAKVPHTPIYPPKNRSRPKSAYQTVSPRTSCQSPVPQ